MDVVALVAVLVSTLALAGTNGVHDAAGAVATSVATRALTPRAARVLAALLTAVGALFGGGVVQLVPREVLVPAAPGPGVPGLLLLLCALLGALVWCSLAWWRAVPVSTGHALVGGLAGAATASGDAVRWDVVLGAVLVPALGLGVLAVGVAAAATVAALWLVRGAMPHRAHRRLRAALPVAAAATALGQGLVSGQRAVVVVVLALVAAGHADDDGPGAAVVLVVAAVLALGAWTGGGRVARTVGERLAPLDPTRALVAQAAGALVLHAAALLARLPVAGVQVVAAGVVGATVVGSGASGGPRRVRWGVVRRVLLGWLLTAPAAGLVAAALHLVLSPLGGA